MTSAAPSAREAALNAFDVGALRDVLSAVPPSVWALGPWATAVTILRSLAKLAKDGSGGPARGVQAVALDLQGNGVGAELESLARAPQQLAQLSSVAAFSGRIGALPELRQPNCLDIPAVTPATFVARLSDFSARAGGQETAFASLSTLGTILRAISVHTRTAAKAAPESPLFSLPTDTLASAAPWQPWGVSLATMSGVFASLGFGSSRTAIAVSPASITQRLDALGAYATAPPPSATLLPMSLERLGGLLSAVTAVTALEQQLSINLLKPGWPDLLRQTVGRAATASEGIAASGAAMPSPEALQQLASIRSTLGGVNRLQAIGLPLRQPDARERLAGVMTPLLQFRPALPTSSVGGPADGGSDPAFNQRLLQALSMLYSSFMHARVQPNDVRTRRNA